MARDRRVDGEHLGCSQPLIGCGIPPRFGCFSTPPPVRSLASRARRGPTRGSSVIGMITWLRLGMERVSSVGTWVARLFGKGRGQPGLVLVVSPDVDPDDVQVLLIAGVLHRQGVVCIRAIIAAGGPFPRQRALLARIVLDQLGVRGVPVGVGHTDSIASVAAGASVGVAPAVQAPPVADVRVAGPTAVGCGADILAAALAAAADRSLTVVSTSSLREVADLIKREPALFEAKVAEVAVQGGLERSNGEWVPDSCMASADDMSAAVAVYAFCLGRRVPLSVVSKDASPVIPMQLAKSFAVRSNDPLLRHVAAAQTAALGVLWRRLCTGELSTRCTKAWFFATFCGADDDEVEERGLEALGADADVLPLLSGVVKPAGVTALMSVLPHTRHLFPAGEAVVDRAHRFFLRPRHALDSGHVLKLLRDTYHEVILLVHDTAKAKGTEDSLFGFTAGGGTQNDALGRDGSGSGDGGSGDGGSAPGALPVFPLRARRGLRDQLRAAAPGVSSSLSSRPLSLASLSTGGSELAGSGRSQVTALSSGSSVSHSYADDRSDDGGLDAWDVDAGTGARREAFSTAARTEGEVAAELVCTLESALTEATVRQWQVSIPLALGGLLVIVASVRRQLSTQDRPDWWTDAHVTMRADMFAVLYLVGLSLLLLALQPTRRFLGLVRFAVAVIAFVYALGLASSIVSFGRQFADALERTQSVVQSLSWESFVVVSMLAGSLVHLARSLRAHWACVHALAGALFFVVAVASGSETLVVFLRRLLLGWVTGTRGALLASATVARTAIKGALSVLLLWPRFRSRVHAVVARALRSSSHQRLAPLAPLIGFGSVHGAKPNELVRGAAAVFCPVALDDEALLELQAAWEAGLTSCPERANMCVAKTLRVTASSGGALQTLSENQQLAAPEAKGEAGPSYFVVHARTDDAAAKADALRAWARAKAMPPSVWVEPLCADVSLFAHEHLSHAVVNLALCDRLLLVAGPMVTDCLRCVSQLYTWTCLGRDLDRAEVVLAAPLDDEQTEQEVLAGFDAFAIMYASSARSAFEEAQIVLSAELATASAYNEAVCAYVPLLRTAIAHRAQLRAHGAEEAPGEADECELPARAPDSPEFGPETPDLPDEAAAAILASPLPPSPLPDAASDDGSADDPLFVGYANQPGAADAIAAALQIQTTVPEQLLFRPRRRPGSLGPGQSLSSSSACHEPGACSPEMSRREYMRVTHEVKPFPDATAGTRVQVSPPPPATETEARTRRARRKACRPRKRRIRLPPGGVSMFDSDYDESALHAEGESTLFAGLLADPAFVAALIKSVGPDAQDVRLRDDGGGFVPFPSHRTSLDDLALVTPAAPRPRRRSITLR